MTDTIIIPLTQGYSTVIDSVDTDLAELGWKASKSTSGIYVYRIGWEAGHFGNVQIHRVVLARKLNIDVWGNWLCDHKDQNPLNNRRANLRLATRAQNAQNKRIPSTNTSGVRGVTWAKHTSKWVAFIGVSGKQIHLGSFTDFDKAVAVRREAELRYFGDFAPSLSRQEPTS